MTEEQNGNRKQTDGNRKQTDVLDAKALVKEQFGRTANAYVSSAIHGNESALERVVTALAPQPDWIVLDVATGGGHVAKAVSSHVRSVVATDLTPTMLRAARQHIVKDAGKENVSFVIGDAENLPFLDETFDAVTCRIAPHHFPNPRQFVVEAARVLKPGGRFLLVDNIVPEDQELARWYNTLEQLRDPSHVRCASVAEWEAWMTGCGLTLSQSDVSWKHFEFEPWVRRMITSEAQYEQVSKFLKGASPAAAEHFRIKLADGVVQEFYGLEWLAVGDK